MAAESALTAMSAMTRMAKQSCRVHERGTTRALAAGATEDEITDVLLAIAPVAALGRVTGAVPDVAAALGYDVEAALLSPDDD